MPSIFLSYARGDDGEPFDPATSFVARLHRDLTTAGFDVWFDRVSMPSRSLTFHQEIRDSVATRDRLVLVVGSKAAESLYVRQEWQFAYFEAEKIVTPILRQGDYSHVPKELKLLHCEDFRDDTQYDFHLKNLIRQLAEPAPPLGKLIAVPSLPAHFLSRTERLIVLRDALRADLDRPVVITGAAARVGMHGMGGIGKSVLASSLARDRKVREAFPDGIVWVGLGPLPTIADLQRRVHKDLGGDGAFQTEHEGRVKLREMLKDKRVLLILDDVWRREDVDWFDILGPRCRAMISTRDAGLLTSLGGVHHMVELLTDQEALNILAQAAGFERDQLPSEASDLIAECGRLPLAVALCGGMVRRGLTWSAVLQQLRQARIDRIADRHAIEKHHQSVWHAIHVSVEFLPANERQRFLELAVFPPDEATSAVAIGTLWAHTGQLDDFATRELLVTLAERSLVQIVTRGSSLHDLVYDYVQREAGDAKALHVRLLAAYQAKCKNDWPSGPNDGYFFTHLRHHLIEAGRIDELADLLHELRWLEAKTAAGLVFELVGDLYATAVRLSHDDHCRRWLELIEEAIRADIDFIAKYPATLFQCLWNSCWWYDCDDAAKHYIVPEGTKGPLPWEKPRETKLATLLETWRAVKEKGTPGFVWLRSLRPPMVRLGSGQKAVFRGHEGSVTSVSYSPDGRRIVSGSSDKTVRVWDAASGEPLLCLPGHKNKVTSVSHSPDSRRIVSGSDDQTVRVWDAESGDQFLCLQGHEGNVTSVCYSPDGRRVVSGSFDKTVRMWDAESGDQLLCLQAHKNEVTSVCYSPDGRRVVSGSDDNTIRVWDACRGEQLRCIHVQGISTIRSVCYSPDGRRIVAGSWKTVWVWDADSAEQLLRLQGRKLLVVFSVGYSSDGHRVVSGGHDRDNDNTVRVWDAVGGEQLLCLRGHEHAVLTVCFSPDGRRIVSGSDDQTVRVWDAESGDQFLCLDGNERYVFSVCYSPDGRRIVSCADDHTIRVWDACRGEQLRCIHVQDPTSIHSVCYSPDGRRIVGGSYKTVWVWDADNGELVLFLDGHESFVCCACYSPDGRRIVSGAADNTVRIWNADGGDQLLCLLGHERQVRSVCYSPDGHCVVSGSDDRTIRVWDTGSGKQRLCLLGHESEVFSVCYSLDGRRIVSHSCDDEVRVWDVESGRLLEKIVKPSPEESLALHLPANSPGGYLFHRKGRFVRHTSGRFWADSTGKYICILAVEGDWRNHAAKT